MAQSLPPEALAAALAAVHKTGVATPAPDPTQTGSGGVGSATWGGGASPGATQTDPEDQQDGGQDESAEQQAVWDEFPSTDPQAIQQVAGQMQGGDPQALVEMLSKFMQQAQADQDKLSQMQESMLSQLMSLLGGPSGGGQPQPSGASPVPSQGPGVGGAGSGY